MVARILQNTNYMGSDKYPSLIGRDQFNQVVKAVKPYTQTETQEIKKIKEVLVCSVCGKKLKRRFKASGSERRFCESDTTHISIALNDQMLMDHMADTIKLYCSTINTLQSEEPVKIQYPIDISKIHNEIERIMESSQSQRQELEEQVLQLVALKYQLIATHQRDCIATKIKLEQYLMDQNIISVIEVIEAIKIVHSHITEIVFRDGTAYMRGEKINGELNERNYSNTSNKN